MFLVSVPSERWIPCSSWPWIFTKTTLNWRYWPYCYLQLSCNRAHNAHKRAAYFLSSICSEKIQGSNRQDCVFIRPPGISHGAYKLRMDNVKFFSCSRWSQQQTSAGKSTHVRSSQLLRNTLDLSDQVFYLDYLGYLANLLQSGYLVYLGLLMLLLGSLVGQMQLHHYLRTPLAIANYACHTHNFNIG